MTIGIIFINNSQHFHWEISQGDEIFFFFFFNKLSLSIYLPKSCPGFCPLQGNNKSELLVFILDFIHEKLMIGLCFIFHRGK